MGLKHFQLRIDRIKFTAHYDEFGNLKDQWIGMEAAIDDTETPERQLDKIKVMVDNWYKANNIQINGGYPNALSPDYALPTITSHSAEPQIGVTPEVIMSCQDLVTLDSYRLLIKGKEDLELAYSKRRKEIVDEEVNSILDRTGKLSRSGK